MSIVPPLTPGIERRSENAKQQVYRLLKADIVRGVFDMGEKLNESQIARRYLAGKTPVREALGMLQQEGLVEAVPRVGYLTSRVTVRDMEDIFELRKITEGAAAEKAATSITDDALTRLERLRFDFSAGDREGYLRILEENLQFHCIIADASGNRLLAQVVADLLQRMQRLVVLRLDISSDVEELMGEHDRILEALRNHDPVQARAHMLADIANTHQSALVALRRRLADRHI